MDYLNSINKNQSKTLHGIKVKIQIPESLNESYKKQKINRLYDILKPQKI